MRHEVGLIGAGIGGSLSPALHEREAAEQGLAYEYRLIDIGERGLAPTTSETCSSRPAARASAA